MSTLEERKQSMNYLISVGIFIPYKGLNLYHGRTTKSDNGKEWKVDKRFNNSGNSTGNLNVNAVSVLSTADYSTAKEFADERNKLAYIYVGKPIDTSTSRVYKIITNDKDAVIFNANFDYSTLSDEDRVNCANALKILTEGSLSEMSPIKFENKELYIDVYQALKNEAINKKSAYISYDIINSVYNSYISNKKPINFDILYQVGGAMNARQILKVNPKFIIKRYVIETNENIRNSIQGIEKNVNGPLNMEYFASWAFKNHVIGYKTGVDSATLGRYIENYMIFDKTKINTEKAMGDKMQSVLDSFGEISKIISNFTTNVDLINSLQYSSPTESVNVLYKRGYKEPYNLSAGVSENFLVGEHTETVLRVFDDSFKDDIPESMVPFMKFVLLAHDIGKGYAFKDYGKDKKQEKIYTEKFCREFLFKDCSVNPKLQDLILFIINDSQDLVDKIYIKRYASMLTLKEIQDYKNKMLHETKKQLKNILNREPTKEEIRGLISICKILLTCDGGAYSRYAVTRDKKTGMYYKNRNDCFTQSFAQPADIRGREIKFPERGE